MVEDRRDDEGELGSELDLDVGDELDLDLIAQEAAKVERRTLRIDFDEALKEAEGSFGQETDHGASSLETASFLSKKEREALERARGGTPTLKRLGKKAPRPSRPGADGPTLPMDTEMLIVRSGLPVWAWVLITIVSITALALMAGFILLSPADASGTSKQALGEPRQEQTVVSQ